MSLGLVSKLVSWAFTSGIGANCWVKPVLYFSFMGFLWYSYAGRGFGGVVVVVLWRERECHNRECTER